jgi:CheY-like chemotaxis protein
VVQFNPEKLQAGGGSGLGLWITKGIIDLHGGVISVYSKGEGFGSTFKVELPMTLNEVLRANEMNRVQQEGSPTHHEHDAVARTSATISRVVSFDSTPRHDPDTIESTVTGSPNVKVGNKTEQTVEAGGDKPHFRLLLVDDSQLNRKMMSRVMESEGHSYEEAADGQQAVDCVKRLLAENPVEAFDAILMDFVMPVLDGPGATKQIRDMGYTGKIFGLTGNALQSDIDTFTDAGADQVLIKPLDMNLFRRAMQS